MQISLFLYIIIYLPGGNERSFASEIGVNVAADDGVVVGCEGGFGRMGVLLSELPLPAEMACKLAGRSTRVEMKSYKLWSS